jgi:hypothetical protein
MGSGVPSRSRAPVRRLRDRAELAAGSNRRMKFRWKTRRAVWRQEHVVNVRDAAYAARTSIEHRDVHKILAKANAFYAAKRALLQLVVAPITFRTNKNLCAISKLKQFFLVNGPRRAR